MTASRPAEPAAPVLAPDPTLSPCQFHARVEAALGVAIVDEEGLRVLARVLEEAPDFVPGSPHPPLLVPTLVHGVRYTIERRRVESPADSEQLLADLLEFILAFYPEAVPPAAQI